jgi:hypothetical protein
MLAYVLRSPSDFAFLWHSAGLNSIDNFLLKNTSKHNR